MQTRGNRLSHSHVEALNAIDLEFGHEKSGNGKKVYFSWKEYRNKLSDKDFIYDKDVEVKFNNLLLSMSQFFGYSFDITDIENNFYSPRAQGDNQEMINRIYKNLDKILNGNSTIPVSIVDSDSKRKNSREVVINSAKKHSKHKKPITKI